MNITSFELFQGDCLEVLKTLPDNSIDSIVTDPPAGIAFMGKDWDKDKGGRDEWIAWMESVARECRRVIKPGGHALVWAIPRTSHWTAMGWENAGWELRDRIAHVFGSGFPKSLSVDKAIDKAAGVEREVVGQVKLTRDMSGGSWGELHGKPNNAKQHNITAPATEAAKQWQGWGTALKPAYEDWHLFRKPVEGTISQNVLKWGVGGLNIDKCRVDLNGERPLIVDGNEDRKFTGDFRQGSIREGTTTTGRWPAHLIHDGSDEVVECFPDAGGGFGNNGDGSNTVRRQMKFGMKATGKTVGFGDKGSAARFFYCTKASKADRNEGIEITNVHPTVKSTDLMVYLCRLITPPNGIVLDPFMGSGSTGKAAMIEGFRFIGIEREEEYLSIAKARIQYALDNRNNHKWVEDRTKRTEEVLKTKTTTSLDDFFE
jgi:DNA modification methylase